MTENNRLKKVTKKTIEINGKKVPYYVCPAGMSGLGVDLEKHFKQEDAEEATLEVAEEAESLEKILKEDTGFGQGYQRFCEEGETDNPLVEDFLAYRDYNKMYDNKEDKNIDLVSIFKY
jgi:hypothetical protein